ncbi:type 2 isopentenyl-diphosphate Delta-isomerase [Candidatus Hodarchaeum mangrovi]
MEVPYKTSIQEQEEKDLVTSNRKLAHLQICLENDVQARSVKTGLNDISFVHKAITDLNLTDIDLSVEIFKKKLDIPLIISGMTGGHNFASKLNYYLSEAVDETKIGMGVGSQRAALEDSNLRESFEIVRKNAPRSLIIGNIGSGQIALGLSKEEFEEIIDMIEANAVAIHFNPLQEAIQIEGDTNLSNLHSKISNIIKNTRTPVIPKEVGSGFTLSDINDIQNMKFSGIDIQGVGGTSWAGVESIRANSSILKRTGEVFWDWGIPTALSTVLATRYFKGVIIGSGGVRNGLDVGKLLALGADVAGMAIPFLFATQFNSSEPVVQLVREIEYQLRLCCFLTGSKNLGELKKAPLLITGKTAENLRLYGIDPKEFLNR